MSSNGSASPSLRGGLQRQNSSGSMTERSFRDPSPSRKTSASMRADDPPPVPALPKGYMSSPPPLPAKSGRRAASVEPPERVVSPPPRPSGRGVSLDRGPGVTLGRGDIRSYYKPKIASLDEERAQNRESINFSRPMSPRNSPPTSPLAGRRPQSPLSQSSTVAQRPANSSSAQRLPEGEAQNIANRMQETLTRPVKKKKKAVAKDLAEGSHLAADGSGNRIIGTALEATPQRQPPSASSTPSPSAAASQPAGLGSTVNTAPRRKNKRAVPAAGPQASSYASDTDSVVSDVSSSAERPRNYNTRAARLLAKQPSIVREDREAEEKEDRTVPVKKAQETVVQNGSISTEAAPNMVKPLANGQEHKKSASQPSSSQSPANAISLDTGSTPRHQSLSPARAARFSSQPILNTPEEMRHQPPARSVSPAKSALKHSPSPRGPSPVGFIPGGWNRSHGKAASEASDTTSVISDDGLKPASRKKSVRVSFDDEPIAVGRAASPPTSPDSPVILSPQNTENPNKAWYGSGREKKKGIAGSDSEQESIMKPTPMLPSFGSIRNRNDQARPGPGSTVNQDKPEEQLGETQVSTDQVVGSVLYQDLVSKASSPGTSIPQHASNDPLPPEVTSVEGTGYHSDTDHSAYSEDGDESFNSPTTLASSLSSNGTALGQNFAPIDSAVEEEPMQVTTGSVPSIAVQPATPGTESREIDREDWFGMPGGFPAPREVPHPHEQSTGSIVEHHATDPTPASIGISEPEPEEAHHEPGTPVVGEVADGLRIQIDPHHDEESEDSGSSIYSDAAEDLSDLEGDGFGSINAIVESPVIAPVVPATSPPESPSQRQVTAKPNRPSPLARNESELSEPAQEEGWDRAQQYWSGLSHSRKQQLERAAATGAVEEPRTEPKPKPKKKKVMTQNPSQPRDTNQDAPFPPWPDKQYREDIVRSKSPTVPAMKKSMRASGPEPSQETHMRSSMRNSAPLKSSMRAVQPSGSPEPRGALQKKHRPVSAVAMVDYNKSQNKASLNHGRAASMGTQPKPLTPVPAQPKKKTTMRRALSTGSDSSSSFKKARSSTASDGNRYSMKRSMRAGSVDSRPQSVNIRSSSARSPSPSGAAVRRPFSSVGPSTAGPSMRTSMRSSMDSGKQNRTKSPIRSLGFGRNPKPAPAASKPKSRFSSRFGDSSDEEDGPRTVCSRFADSSDEDEPTGLTPVRGIPRRIDEGDSTDLDDSSAENSPKTPKTKSTRAAPPSQLEGAALATGSLRGGVPAELGTGLQAKRAAENETKKRSFFGALGSKRRDDSKVRKSDIESAARRDTPLERSGAERGMSPLSPVASPKAERVLGEAVSPTTQQATASPRSPASPKSPKLQRRNTPMRLPMDSWPLPQGPVSVGDGRPNTSDGGVSTRERPELGNRRSTGQVVNGVVVSAKTGKKKRFPMLRKAFGLHD